MEYTKTEIIPQSLISEEILCPQCKGNNIEISGVWERGFKETRYSGQPIEQNLDNSLYMNVQELICIQCKVQFLIMDDEEFSKQVSESQIKDHEEALLNKANTIPKEQLN